MRVPHLPPVRSELTVGTTDSARQIQGTRIERSDDVSIKSGSTFCPFSCVVTHHFFTQKARQKAAPASSVSTPGVVSREINVERAISVFKTLARRSWLSIKEDDEFQADRERRDRELLEEEIEGSRGYQIHVYGGERRGEGSGGMELGGDADGVA